MVAIEYLPVIIGLSETFQLCCQHFHDSHLLPQHSDLTQGSSTSVLAQTKILLFSFHSWHVAQILDFFQKGFSFESLALVVIKR